MQQICLGMALLVKVIEHVVELAAGDLASQEELEALQVRTGNTPPGAPAHAPSLPPGLPPRLLLRSASAPLAFACAPHPNPGGDASGLEGCGLGGAVGVALPPARRTGALGSPEPPAWRRSTCAGIPLYPLRHILMA